MSWQIWLGSGGILGALAIFFYIVKFFVKMQSSIEKLEIGIKDLKNYVDFSISQVKDCIQDHKNSTEAGFKELKQEIKEIRHDIAEIKSQMDKLEVRVEERTFVRRRGKW